MSSILALSGLAALAGCGSEDNETPSINSGPTLSMPSELQFKKIEGQFQQQQQQMGPLCPYIFSAQVETTGKITIIDPVGQQLVTGQVGRNDLVPLATSANRVTQDEKDLAMRCDDPFASPSPSPEQKPRSQVFITDMEDSDELVVESRADKICDYTKSGAGKQLQQQFMKVVQQTCNGQLPTPSPRPTISASPSPVVSPSPSPTTSPSPSPSPSPSATASPGPSATPTVSPSPSPSVTIQS